LQGHDLDRYYRVPADSRDLNYETFTRDGDKAALEFSDYTSESTQRLSVEEIVDLLMTLDYVKHALKGA
jgi:UDP-N-acetylglucosamine 4,6-dehydratase/5-epimerase